MIDNPLGGRSVEEYRQERRSAGAPITLAYFEERSIPEPNSGCWIWLGALHKRHGYGAVRAYGSTTRAHRLCFEVTSGQKLPSSIDVCHTCDVRCCVNPDHLFMGTRTDNMQDCSAKGRIVVPELRGESCPAAKLTEAQVLAIRADPRSQRAIAIAYGVDKGTIAHIKHRKTWRHI
ncbi:HNH endonuclease [Nitratireductor sp. L1-7-SE]|uniref:HNH endonuclease n=2 Tax=Nitratireductor rhodophyticola TaxID=2854036 RepID=A0ABS7RH43_9HYPH|nr:HNH endonuclease [Nitratireductor rhodophyticola]MBY8920031.1 HNH endonuclease [Nitratireductor rhodophyticola]